MAPLLICETFTWKYYLLSSHQLDPLSSPRVESKFAAVFATLNAQANASFVLSPILLFPYSCYHLISDVWGDSGKVPFQGYGDFKTSEMQCAKTMESTGSSSSSVSSVFELHSEKSSHTTLGQLEYEALQATKANRDDREHMEKTLSAGMARVDAFMASVDGAFMSPERMAASLADPVSRSDSHTSSASAHSDTVYLAHHTPGLRAGIDFELKLLSEPPLYTPEVRRYYPLTPGECAEFFVIEIETVGIITLCLTRSEVFAGLENGYFASLGMKRLRSHAGEIDWVDIDTLQNQEELPDKVEKRIEQMMVRLEEMLKTKKDLTPEEKTVDRMLLDLEKTRDLSQTIVVVDADAFYASVEELYNPELKGKLFIDLRSFGRGYIDRIIRGSKFGVRSGMAGYIAGKLCPGILMVKPDFKRYSEASKKVMDVLATFDPNYAPASLDEAYLNVSSYIVSLYLSGYSNSNKRDQKQNGLTPEEVGVRIREKVKEISGLTVSCGVTPNCMLSKIAADLNKPNRDAIKEFMKNMPVRKVPGIGRVSERWLQALEIKSLGDVFDSRGRLYLVRNEIGLGFLLRGYLGLGSTKVEPHKREGRKSIGNEQTFSTKGERGDDGRMGLGEFKSVLPLLSFPFDEAKFAYSIVSSHADQRLNRALILDLTKDSDDKSIENGVSTKGQSGTPK
ncbi:DNA/RNA polymerase [Atractiella rhizophila]|nr:DNA/RNA polymerase [Atractiella rhizophila]